MFRFFSVASFLIAFCYPGDGFGQTKKVDSLKRIVSIASDQQKKLKALLLLCEQRASMSTDTLLRYAGMAKELAQKSGDKVSLSLSEYEIAFCLAKQEKFDTALSLTNRELDFNSKEKHPAIYTRFSLLKSRILDRQNKYADALSQLYSVLKEAEESDNTSNQVIAKNGIGWIQIEMAQHKEALAWFYSALNSTINPENIVEYSALYSNLATTYNALHKNDSAEYFIEKAIAHARKTQTLTFLATSLSIKADILLDTNRESEAEALLLEVIDIRKLIGDPYYIVYDMSKLAKFYSQSGQSKKAEELCYTGIELAKKNGLSSQLLLIYQVLADHYKLVNNSTMYGETLEDIIRLKDSLHTINTSRILAELQVQYDIQKKENIIVQQKLDLVQKNILFYSLIAFLLFATTTAFLFFRQYKKRQQLKLQLMQQEEKRNSEKAVMEAEEAERKRIAADLHDSLGAYAASIASNIQQMEEVSSSKNSLMMQELKSNSQAIVAQLSDTIWVLKKDALLLTAISDRLKLFIQKLGPSYPSITFDVYEEIITDFLLPPAQAFHLFQIIKEAVNNALKHSQCSQILVRIQAGERWKVTITDNGKGIKQEVLFTEPGNGLVNMKERIKECNWKIEWVAATPSGTNVIIQS